MNKIEITFTEEGTQVQVEATMMEASQGTTALIKAIAKEIGEDPIEIVEAFANRLRYEKARESGMSHDEAWKLYGDEG